MKTLLLGQRAKEPKEFTTEREILIVGLPISRKEIHIRAEIIKSSFIAMTHLA